MGKKNKGGTIIVILAIVALVGFALNQGGFLDFSVVDSSVNEYTCPVGKHCVVQPVLECDIAIEDEKVVFRTNAVDGNYDGKWIAVDRNGNGLLESYTHKSTFGTSGTCDGLIGNTPEGYCIEYANLKIRIYTGPQSGFSFEESNDADLSTTPKEPYKTNGQELYGGNVETFQCSRDVLKSGSLQYTLSSNQQGRKEGIQLQLEGGEEVTSPINPNSQGNLVFEVLSINDDQITTCDYEGQELLIGQKICDGDFKRVTCEDTGFTSEQTRSSVEITEVCRNGEWVEVVECDYGNENLIEGDSICEDRFTIISCDQAPNVETDQLDPSGNERCKEGDIVGTYDVSVLFEKTSISSEEEFVINIDLDDPIYLGPDYRDLIVEAKLIGDGEEDSISKNLDSFGKATIKLKPTDTGSKEIEIFIEHPDEPEDYFEVFDVNVGNPLEATTFRTQKTQFDNNDIVVLVEVSKDGTAFNVGEDNIEIDAKFKGTQIDPTFIENTKVGEYEYIFQLQDSGTFQYRTRTTDDIGLQSEWNPKTGFSKIDVLSAEILFKDEKYPFNICNGSTQTSSFKIVDTNGDAIKNASITVDITLPDGNKEQGTAIEASSGKYEITHTYSEGGAYFISLEAEKGDIKGTSESNPVNVLSCDGGVSSDGAPNDKTKTYIIIGILVVIGLAIWFFIKKR